MSLVQKLTVQRLEFELYEWESFKPQLTISYEERSPAHGYSDSTTELDIDPAEAQLMIEILQRFIKVSTDRRRA